MAELKQIWKTVTHGFDARLWRRGLWHPFIGPLLRNLALLSLFCLAAGAACFAFTPWLFWFGVGVSLMALIFFGLARFFLRSGLGDYSSAFLRVVLLRWGGRLLALAGLLYVALIVCKAPPAAILGGFTVGAAAALLTCVAARGQG
ncbi:MAG: hypothetical protein LBR31_04245 [Desulfovibrio sp.]|jgi:hypothetical protein|nr:hypothetical protein [Desulfovibrio sp.]